MADQPQVSEASQAADEAPPMPATVEQCHVVIGQLTDELKAMRLAIEALTERVSLNSRNSSKPPSSDGPGRGGRSARGSGTGRKRGAQKGHTGTFRALLPESQVDRVQDCKPPERCACGGTVEVTGQARRHQVFDLPPVIKPVVSEYRLYTGVCRGCRRAHAAQLPAGVPSGQIGPRALGLVGMLGTRFQMPQMKIRDLMAQLLGIDFSVGAISQAQGKLAQALDAPVHAAMAEARKAGAVHVDETPYPGESSKGNWAWSVVLPQAALYTVLPSRARYVFTSLLGDRPAGVVITDRYSAYAHLPSERRQVCWAHLLRDFRRIAERSGAAGEVGRRLLGLGYVMFRRRHRLSEADAPSCRTDLAGVRVRVRQALERGAALLGCPRTAATCANLLKIEPALWTFTTHAEVPPTNNSAEQALRPVVLKRKISGPTRSRRGANFIARGFSVAETCRRQGRDLLDYLQRSVCAWIDKTEAPALLRPAIASG